MTLVIDVLELASPATIAELIGLWIAQDIVSITAKGILIGELLESAVEE